MVVEKEFNVLTKGPVFPARYIYFITDVNRSDIKVGITDDINYFAKNLSQNLNLFDESTINKLSLVYFEEYNDVFLLKERFKIINKWTRMQKEKLIRFYNKDWTDLTAALIVESNTSAQKNPAIKPGFNYN